MNGTEKKVNDPLPISLIGNLLTVSTTSPLPPGSRVSIELSAKAPNSSVRLSGKVVFIDSSTKGLFTIKARLHSVTKEDEAVLNSILDESK